MDAGQRLYFANIDAATALVGDRGKCVAHGAVRSPIDVFINFAQVTNNVDIVRVAGTVGCAAAVRAGPARGSGVVFKFLQNTACVAEFGPVHVSASGGAHCSG